MTESFSEVRCLACGDAASLSANFCSQCGRKIKEPPFSISVAKQLLVYGVSFFLAPFGLGFVFKYLPIHDSKARTVGIIALVLTIISIVLVLSIGTAFFRLFYGSLNALTF